MAIEQPPILLGPPAKLELQECGIKHRGRVPFPAGELYPARGTRLLSADARHRPVFDAIDRLQPGEAIRLNVDHDPAPLLEIVASKHPGRYSWEPLLEGPARWVGLLRRRPADRLDLAEGSRETAAPAAPDPRPRTTYERETVRLSSALERRATEVGAAVRLERELRNLTADLLGAYQPGDVSPETATWVATATEAAVRPVRDASLAALTRALDVLLEVAPPQVCRQLEKARERHETGLI